MREFVHPVAALRIAWLLASMAVGSGSDALAQDHVSVMGASPAHSQLMVAL